VEGPAYAAGLLSCRQGKLFLGLGMSEGLMSLTVFGRPLCFLVAFFRKIIF
jgi:hypothetical protein